MIVGKTESKFYCAKFKDLRILGGKFKNSRGKNASKFIVGEGVKRNGVTGGRCN